MRRLIAACVAALLLAGPAFANDAELVVYRAARGDTLIGIGARLLVEPGDWRKVAQLNRIANPDFVLPGTEIRIPLSLVRSDSLSAMVVEVVGEARATPPGGQSIAVAVGANLPEATELATGRDGYVTLQLADGTMMRVQAASTVKLLALRRYREMGIIESAVRLVAGRLESLVDRLRGGGARYRVETPNAALSVRGTEFRTAADADRNETRAEVLAGEVGAAGAARDATERRVAAGFGTVADSAGRVAEPQALLRAPDLAGLPALQERPLVRFGLQALAGASAYRAQVAPGGDFRRIVADNVSGSPDLRIADLPDGDYALRVRGIDALGLEGFDATHAFRLKARPEPPFPSTPPRGGKLRASGAGFSWAENPQAATYHFQLARDPGFGAILRDERALRATTLAIADLAPGEYHWRVASVRADGDHGPFGDAQSFNLFPPPAAPEPPEVGNDAVTFAWPGEPGQVFDFQLASDQAFANLVLERRVDEPRFGIPRPAPGTYYMRFRAIDPDGFVGPYSSLQRFSVPSCMMDGSGRCIGSTYQQFLPAPR